jgi:tryptophan synthase beta chain
LPFVGDVIKKKLECRFVAVQAAVDRFRTGEYRYDFMDEAEMLPLEKIYTLGVHAPTPPLYAEGLRYPAASPLISLLLNQHLIEPGFYGPEQEVEVLKAGLTLFHTEGILPAPESAYGVKAGIDEALKAKATGKEEVIVVNVSGHGFIDLDAYREGVFEKLPPFQNRRAEKPLVAR